MIWGEGICFTNFDLYAQAITWSLIWQENINDSAEIGRGAIVKRVMTAIMVEVYKLWELRDILVEGKQDTTMAETYSGDKYRMKQVENL